MFIDVNECGRSCKPCHQLAACTNEPGTYKCSCHQGFSGDGVHSCQGDF